MKSLLEFEDLKLISPAFYRWSSPLLEDHTCCIVGSSISCYQIQFATDIFLYHIAMLPPKDAVGAWDKVAGYVGCTALSIIGNEYHALVSTTTLTYKKQSWDKIMMAIVKLESQ